MGEELYKTISATTQKFLQKNPHGVIIIWGPTAAGKTSLSIRLALCFNCEIISADARQIYKFLDIATSKVDRKTREEIPHYCIDYVEPNKIYSAAKWKHDVYSSIKKIHNRKKVPCIVGGTGLYIDMLYKNFALSTVAPQRQRRKEQENRELQSKGTLHKDLMRVDPDEALKLHPNALRHIIRALEIFEFSGKTKTSYAREKPVDFPILHLGLRREKNDINKRINQTIQNMVKIGLIEETRWLLEQGYTSKLQSMQSIGYPECTLYIKNVISRDKTIELMKKRTHHLAKKQRTRFRKYIRDYKINPKKDVFYAIYNLSQ